MKTLLLTLGLALALQTGLRAEPTTKPAEGDATAAAKTEGSVVEASDKDALAANQGKDVTVEGKVSSARWSGSGKVMNGRFANSDLSIVIFQSAKEKLDEQFSGDVAKSLSGATVRIKGKLESFKDKPEIKITQGSQITIVDAAPTTAPSH